MIQVSEHNNASKRCEAMPHTAVWYVGVERCLFLYRAKLLNVNRFHHFLAVGYRGLLESLTATEFLYDAGLFKFTFEFLEGAFDEFAFLYLYDDHVLS